MRIHKVCHFCDNIKVKLLNKKFSMLQMAIITRCVEIIFKGSPLESHLILILTKFNEIYHFTRTHVCAVYNIMSANTNTFHILFSIILIENEN